LDQLSGHMSSLLILRYPALALLIAAGACSGAPGSEPPANRSPSPFASSVEGASQSPAPVHGAATTGGANGPVALIARGVTLAGPPPGEPSCNLPFKIRPRIDCTPSQCGSNSPLVNAFPYNGLHPDGCANQDGAALVRGSLNRGVSACDRGGQSPLYLDVVATTHGHELVAKDAQNKVVCTGAALVGATFDVAGAGGATVRISQMALIDVKRPPGSTGPVLTRAAYLITPAARPGSSLCAPSSETTDRDPPIVHNQIAAGGALAFVSDEGLAGYAIVVAGAVYDREARLIPESIAAPGAPAPGSSHQWFNFACATDALAHSELSGVTTQPIVDRVSAEARLPALHMFTARYCDGVSGTVRGARLSWSGKGIPRPKDAGPIEAEWDKDGAICLSHSRLWTSNKTISLPMQLVVTPGFTGWPKGAETTEDEFLARFATACQRELRKCPAKVPPDVLTSYTVDHAE
jgi:hypothetical protein